MQIDTQADGRPIGMIDRLLARVQGVSWFFWWPAAARWREEFNYAAAAATKKKTKEGEFNLVVSHLFRGRRGEMRRADPEAHTMDGRGCN